MTRAALVASVLLVSATARAQLPAPWVEHALPDGFRDLEALACADESAFARAWQGQVARFDGSGWAALDDVPDGDVGSNLVTNPEGTVLFTTVRGGIARYQDGRWTRADAPLGPTYSTQIVAFADRAFAVGRGRVVAWGGEAYAAFASGTWRDLGAVWGLGERDLWMGGRAGTVVHFDGRTLERHPIPTEGHIRRFHGVSARDVWATVEHPHAIFHWDGSTWTDRTLGLEGAQAVHATRDAVVAVGAFGVVRWDGAAWQDLHRVEVEPYSAPAFVDVCFTRSAIVVAGPRSTWVRAR